MVVECSNCHAKYNVDENKIPATGVKVKCRKCQNIILIKKEEQIPKPEVPESTVQAPSEIQKPSEPAIPPAVPPESKPEIPTTPTEPEIPSEQPPSPEMPTTPAAEEIPKPPEPEMPKPEAPVEEPPPEVPRPPEPEIQPPSEQVKVTRPPEPEAMSKPTPAPAAEMSAEDKKWHERARRLAKALASDLVLYNRDKVDEGLREGTLAQLLGSQIRRSWEYYCQQIPKHIVEATDYFKEQLNKIVGKGKEIFK